ncbi:MAG: NAD-dependent epimerase/dehydratase family protein [Deltaproteobacteria bacterium]|nr:NAD-dependent epimerase/dehydratase family protein [Deltaproteobacteria bacterium]
MVPRSPRGPHRRVVAVTGAAAFLGSELIRRLEQDRRYAKILALDVRPPDVPAGKTDFHKIDLTLPTADAEVAELLRKERADTLVHLAYLYRASHNAAWSHELEAIGTMHVLNACAASQVRKVVQKSTTALYGADPRHPNVLPESQTLVGSADCAYLRDKVEAERLVRRFRSENPQAVVTVLRMAPILGPRIGNLVSRYFGRPVVPVLMGYDPLMQLLHEDDAVSALKLALDADFHGEYNVAAPGVLPLGTLLALAGRIALPLPLFAARPLAGLLWMAQLSDAPPPFLDFLRYLCVADLSKSQREMGFTAKHDIRRVVETFAGDAPAEAPRTAEHLHAQDSRT